MKHLLIIALWIVLSLGSGALAADAKTVQVTFRSGVTTQQIKEISHAFAAPAKQVNGQIWVFQVPALKNTDAFAELFAALPTVAHTDPVPAYKIADHISPQALNVQPVVPTAAQRSENFLPGEMLVKFKSGVSADEIRFFNQNNDLAVMSRISGIDVYRLRLPAGMSVQQAMALYGQSELVEYAEPNYRMGIPTPVSPAPSASPVAGSGIPNGTAVVTQIPLDGGGQILVHFRPGTNTAAVQKFQRIYGTRTVKKVSFYSYRLQLPAGLNPAVAARIFKLYPRVNDVQRLYS